MGLLDGIRARLTSVPVSLIASDAAAPTVVSRERFLHVDPPVRVQLGERTEHLLRDTVVRDLCHGEAPCLERDRYWSEPYTFVRLRDARVHVRWGLVQDRPGRFLEESVHATRWLNPLLSELPRYPTVGGGSLPEVTRYRGIERARTRAPRLRLRAPHLVLGHWSAHNYGHFIMDCLPGAFAFRDELRAGALSLIARPLVDWQRGLLARLGIPSRAVVEVEDEVAFADDLIFPLSLGCGYTVNPGPLHRDMFRALAAEPADSAPARIYVSRATRVGSRVMVNEDALAAGLAARGFTTVDPGTLSVDEQAELFARARVIVGALGAGLTNIGYAPAGCAVIEILPEAVTETWIAHLSRVLGHRFVFIIAKTVRTRSTSWSERTDVEFDYETPVDATFAAIDQLIG